MDTKAVDYIIVGQGLAGSCLALQLLYRSKKILVIDNNVSGSATKIAAGLFNPFTGKRMAKTWMADELFPYFHGFYKQAETFTNTRFFFPVPLFRPFVSVEEQNEWMGKSTDENFIPYINAVHTQPFCDDQVKNELGGVLLKQCGYLNTLTFSKAVRTCLINHGSLLEETLDEGHLSHDPNGVMYKNWSARKIIFCTGEYIGNTCFSWIPIQFLKGEIITIKTEVKVSTIYNRGVYVVPDIWKVGATYNFLDKSPGVTPEGKREITEKLEQLISFPYSITDHQWGRRPATHDRRPILGPHPEFEHFVIFNGLGTKGVSLAPYFSDVLAAWMEKGIPLNDEVAVNRYKSVYWKSALE